MTEERTVTEAAVRAVTVRIGLEAAVTAQIKTATAAAAVMETAGLAAVTEAAG